MKERMEKEIKLMQNQVKEKIDFSEGRLGEISTLLNKHQKTFDSSNSNLIELNSKISVLNSKKEDSLKLKDKITAMENCPTCFQKVSDEHKQKISKHTQFDIEDINRELEQKLQLRHITIK